MLKDLTPGSDSCKTGHYGILCVIGPNADRMFKKLTGEKKLSNNEVKCFPMAHAQWLFSIVLIEDDVCVWIGFFFTFIN